MALRHHGQHDPDMCAPCRWKTVQLSPAATPTRMNDVPPEASRYNAWERGIVTERRPGGFEMPVIDSKGLIGVKKWADNRHRYDDARKRVRQDPKALTGGN